MRPDLGVLHAPSEATYPAASSPYSAVWSISHRACRAPTLACLWHSVTRPSGLSWVSANRWDRNWPSPPVPARPGGAPMTTAAPSTALATIQPAFTDPERLALAGFLAG